jgi:hypothetical protein
MTPCQPSIAQQKREYLSTIFASLVPPRWAGETAFALPSLDGQLSTGRTLTLSRQTPIRFYGLLKQSY